MNKYLLDIEQLTQIFGRRLIFENINYLFNSGSIYGIAGRNGSGKSTLARIILGLITPTKGKIIHSFNGDKIIPEKLHDHIGFVSPYLVLYDEFSAEENMIFFSRIRGIEYDKAYGEFLLEEFQLGRRKNDLLKTYSSGMKQRMKFIFALLHKPELLLLDEPTENLDETGKNKVYEIIRREAKDKLTIIASNEKSDLDLCSDILQIEEYLREGGNKQ